MDKGVAPDFLGKIIITVVFVGGLILFYMIFFGPWAGSVCTFFGDTGLNDAITSAQGPVKQTKFDTLRIGSCVESITLQKDNTLLCVKYKNVKDSNCKELSGVLVDLKSVGDKLEPGNYRMQISQNLIKVTEKI